jgi:hypothetical protein
MEEKKLGEILKKLESEYGWSFYDEDNELHFPSMTAHLIIDTFNLSESELLSKEAEITRLKGLIDKAFKAGEEYEAGLLNDYYPPNLETWKQQNNL